MSTAIELRNVEKNFGITSVIRNVSLTVAQGERHALIGQTGIKAIGHRRGKNLLADSHCYASLIR